MTQPNAPMLHNVYCDESCHLENDGQPIMALGAIWCPQQEARRLGAELRDMKARHRARGELWSWWIGFWPSRRCTFGVWWS